MKKIIIALIFTLMSMSSVSFADGHSGKISLAGFFVSLYHIYLQNGGGGGGSCAIDVPCNLKYVDIFGFISIPVMAGTAFLTIFISLLYYDYARKEHIE